MGYYGYFGQDPTTIDPSAPPPTDPGTSLDPSQYGGTLPGGTSYPPGGTIYGSPPPGGSLPPSGNVYPPAQQLPGSSPYPPPSGGGLQPYPGGSSSSNLPGMPVGGAATVPLPTGPAWAVAPVVQALYKSPTNALLFTTPTTSGNQRTLWIQLVLRQMIGSGYFEPGNSAAALGAIDALSQAFGYFVATKVAPNDPTAILAGGVGSVALVNASIMSRFLTDAYNATLYWQSTPSYQKALATTQGWIKPGGLTAQDIARAAAALPPVSPTAAAAGSGNTMLYVGLVGAAGLAAYLALA